MSRNSIRARRCLIWIWIATSHISASSTTAELFFSQYIEGSSFNKALEIFNPDDSAVDLSDYDINIYFNGNLTPLHKISLPPVSLLGGQVFVLTHTQFDLELQNPTDTIDLMDHRVLFNGNDAVALLNQTIPVDVIGQIGFDPGQDGWGSGMTSTFNHTLRRFDDIQSGDPIGDDPFDPTLQWQGFAQDDVTGLGRHLLAHTIPEPLTSSIVLTIAALVSVRQNRPRIN